MITLCFEESSIVIELLNIKRGGIEYIAWYDCSS